MTIKPELPVANPVEWEKKPRISCIICTSPRTGSSLLSYGLQDTGLAGHPTEYFGPTGEAAFAKEFGLSGDYSLRGYLRAMAVETASENGVLAVKLFMAHLTHLLRRARKEFGSELTESELLEECFPNPKFIFLRREDLVHQAVSFMKAINTFQFESGHASLATGWDPEAFTYSDFSKITTYVETFRYQEREWREFFERNRISPHEVLYEDLASDYQRVVLTALASLGIAPPAGLALPQPRIAKQSDAATERIVARYAEYQSHVRAAESVKA
jgi:LPS sulfotransferase NodH